MTDQEINIAIAKACGKLRRVMTDEEWKLRYKKWCAEPDDPHAELTCPSTHDGTVPDYCNDLNAMHEAEDELDGLSVNTKSIYYDYLLLGVSEFWEHKDSGFKREPFNRDWAVLRSTSRQRAEAFLRCKGLWREAK